MLNEAFLHRAIANLKERRDKVLEGKFNCVPLPFPRFRSWFPGIEKERYIITTANQKVGKSKFSDYLFIYDPFFKSIADGNIKIKVLYFSLEMSKMAKFYEFVCHLLYRLDKIRLSPVDLKSTDPFKILSEEHLKLIESDRYSEYLLRFLDTVEFIDDIKGPAGINIKCEEFAKSRGECITKEYTDEQGVVRRKFDHFEPYDPNEIMIIMLDNYTNLSAEQGKNKQQTIEQMSKYFIVLRDRYSFLINAIQHQTQAQEGVENFKLGKLAPSTDGLGDCKLTSRDCNMVIGLFNPAKFKLETSEGYNVKMFGDHLRILEILEDRDNGSNQKKCPLFFDGAISSFQELPKPDEKDKLKQWYHYIGTLSLGRNPNNKVYKTFMTFSKKVLNKLRA